MSFAGVFDAIAARYGQVVTVAKDGVTLGSGRAVLRPMLDRKSQFVPTDLGLARVEETLCLGQVGLPFSEEAGVWTVTQGETVYAVVNLRPVRAGEERIYWRAGEERIYWRAVLRRREEGGS